MQRNKVEFTRLDEKVTVFFTNKELLISYPSGAIRLDVIQTKDLRSKLTKWIRKNDKSRISKSDG